jgi:hypothetical protein
LASWKRTNGHKDSLHFGSIAWIHSQGKFFFFQTICFFSSNEPLFIVSRVHDKKLTIVALCSLLTLPSDQVPVSLQSGWNQILLSIAYVFKGLPKAIESKQASSLLSSTLFLSNVLFSI